MSAADFLALSPLLMDGDLRLATTAFHGLSPSPYVADGGLPADLFERLEEALPRFPARKKSLEPLVWPWMNLTMPSESTTRRFSS